MTNNAQEILRENFPEKSKLIRIINGKIGDKEIEKGEIKIGKEFSSLKTLFFTCNCDLILILEEGLPIKILWLDYSQIDLKKLNIVSFKNTLTQLNLSGNTLNAKFLEEVLSQLNLEYLVLSNAILVDDNNKKKTRLSLKMLAGKKLRHLSFEGTDFTPVGLSDLLKISKEIKYLYPNDIISKELDNYDGKNYSEKIEKWTKDEIVQGILKRIEELKQPQHLNIIEKINPEWEELIWILRKIVNKYAKEKLNSYPVHILPARTANDSPFGLNDRTPAYVVRTDNQKIEKGWKFHFGVNYPKVKIMDTIAHEICHLSIALKVAFKQGLYNYQQHSPYFWKGFLKGEGEISSLNYVKNNLPEELVKELEDLYNPQSSKFDSNTSWIYFPEHNITTWNEEKTKDAITVKKTFSSQEEGNIVKEWNYIWQKLGDLHNESMNEGTEQEKKARWFKLNEEQYPRGISIRIKPKKESGQGNDSEIGVIYNPAIMPKKLKGEVENVLEKWRNQPVKPTNLEKAEKIEEQIAVIQVDPNKKP